MGAVEPVWSFYLSDWDFSDYDLGGPIGRKRAPGPEI